MFNEEELDSVRIWLDKCYEKYLDCKKICFSDDLADYFTTLFPIFNDVQFFDVGFSFQDGGIYDPSGLSTKMSLYISFAKKDADKVDLWFSKSFYNKHYYIGAKAMFSSEYVVEIDVKHLIQDLKQHKIDEMHKQLAEEAYDFVQKEKKGQTAFDEYFDKCLEEDPHYLGVKFISYDGEYPNVCSGTLIVEIEGVLVAFDGGVLWGFNGVSSSIRKEAYLGEYERYRYELERVIRDYIETGCCGGCE